MARDMEMRPLITPREMYRVAAAVLIAGFIGIGIGVVISDHNNNLNVQAIYNRGYQAGSATATNQSNVQCDSKLLSLFQNCEDWDVPPSRLGIFVTGLP